MPDYDLVDRLLNENIVRVTLRDGYTTTFQENGLSAEQYVKSAKELRKKQTLKIKVFKTDHAEIGKKIGEVVNKKQEAYGDSFSKSGKMIKILFPDGIPVEKYDIALTLIRIIDKMFRIATDKDAFGENPFQDIAGYSILEVGKGEREPRP